MISKTLQAQPWAQALASEATKPLFPLIPPGVRPYLFAATLFAAASALLYVGDAALLRYGLPWTLVSLLVIVAAANLFGTRPALLVLALSALFGLLMVPHLAPPPVSPTPLAHVLVVRTALFVACGATTVWLTHQARRAQQRAEQRREVVTALQSMILPDMLAEAPGYDLGGLYKPARYEEEVGGDLYDFYRIREGLYGLLIGDVMGKGKEAAASTALLRYSVRAFSSSGMQPAELLSRLNDMIETQRLPFQTATLFVGLLDAHTGLLRYASAGHEPPMLVRAHGQEATLEATGPILGVGLDVAYEDATAVLGPGDSLFLMTDGVTEARGHGGEFLDSGGAWRLLLPALSAPSAREALSSLDATLTAFIGSNSRDDIAMLLLRREMDAAVTGLGVPMSDTAIGEAVHSLPAPILASEDTIGSVVTEKCVKAAWLCSHPGLWRRGSFHSPRLL